MALSATVRFKKSNWLECHCYHYLLLKNQYTNTLLLGDYSRSFKIFENMAEIFYAIKDIKFRNWKRLSKKRDLASQESSNSSIAEKCSCIM